MLLRKAYFTEYTENLFSKMSTDAIFVTSVFTLYGFILFIKWNYEPLRSESQWIFLYISIHTIVLYSY